MAARRYGDIKSVKQLGQQLIHEMESFFVTYNRELGKTFKVLGFKGPRRAEALAREGMKRFTKRHPAGRRR